MNYSKLAAVLLVAGLYMPEAQGQELGAEIAELKQVVAEMRDDYERRIADLEQRLAGAERLANRASRDAEDATELAEQTAIDQSAGSSAPNAFNPGIGAILTGTWADVDRGWDAIPGFMPAGEIGTGDSGFAVGEAEINMKASIDTLFYGNVTVAIADEEFGVEEAWLQTTSLPGGMTLSGGRMFSAAGYLNGFHLHADDFVDRPLPYQAFIGGRYGVDGIQARWVAPTTALFVELGAELNWGDAAPATANAGTSPGAWTAFAKLGGDVGTGNSWQAGIAHISADAVGRNFEEASGEGFSGDSDLTILDFVWKWAPDGNSRQQNLKLQGEYFHRSENGLFDGLAYDGDQRGWYLQGAWQFRPLWRVGLRYDTVSPDSSPLLAGTVLEDPDRDASRASLMFDYSPSEFSRLRLQYTSDRVLPDTENLWYLQYIMSLGAHGAHQF